MSNIVITLWSWFWFTLCTLGIHMKQQPTRSSDMTNNKPLNSPFTLFSIQTYLYISLVKSFKEETIFFSPQLILFLSIYIIIPISVLNKQKTIRLLFTLTYLLSGMYDREWESYIRLSILISFNCLSLFPPILN